MPLRSRRSPFIFFWSDARRADAVRTAPWMSREPFLTEDTEEAPMEGTHAAEQQRRHCSRREQLSAILATLATLGVLAFSWLHAQNADGGAEWPWPLVFAPLVGTALVSALLLLASPLLLPVGQRYSAGARSAEPEPQARPNPNPKHRLQARRARGAAPRMLRARCLAHHTLHNLHPLQAPRPPACCSPPPSSDSRGSPATGCSRRPRPRARPRRTRRAARRCPRCCLRPRSCCSARGGTHAGSTAAEAEAEAEVEAGRRC